MITNSFVQQIKQKIGTNSSKQIEKKRKILLIVIKKEERKKTQNITKTCEYLKRIEKKQKINVICGKMK